MRRYAKHWRMHRVLGTDLLPAEGMMVISTSLRSITAVLMWTASLKEARLTPLQRL